MKKELHPANYRLVVFKDVTCDESFLTRSTVPTKETVVWTDGKEYPLYKTEISNKSHPYYTGHQKRFRASGRVEKFKQRYASVKKEES